MLKLNIGCGDNKIPGYINIDGERTCKPDLVLNIATQLLPYKKETVDEIIFFHCIEHIGKRFHRKILSEMARVLKAEAKLYISYPDFWSCAQMWKENKGGMKTFWEATLYGRQLHPGDYHVCAMDKDELSILMYECGFKNVTSYPEIEEPYNMITVALKDIKGPMPNYEDVIANDMKNMRVMKYAGHSKT